MAGESGNIDVSTAKLASDLGKKLGSKEDEWLQFVDGVMAIVHHCQYKVSEELQMMVHMEEKRRAQGDDQGCQEYKAMGLKCLLKIVTAAKFDPLPEDAFKKCIYTTNYAASLHAELGVSLTSPDPLLSATLTRHPLWRDCDPYRPVPLYCNQMLLYSTGYGAAHQTGFFFFAKANIALELLKNKAFGYLVSMGLLVNDPDGPEDKPTHPTPSLRTAKDVIYEEGVTAFLRPLTVEYPTFRNLVVIHPKGAAVAPKQKTLGGWIHAMDQRTRGGMQDAAADGYPGEISKDLKISTYEELPLHDLGLVLPGKLLTTTNVDFVTFLVELVAVTVVLQQGIEAVKDLSLEDPAVKVLMMTVFPTCLYRLVMLLLNWIWALDYYKSIAQRYVLSKRTANGPAAVAALLHEMQEQDTKLILVAYYVLWTSATPLTSGQLDQQAEDLLKTFSCQADFDVDLALAKLSSLGLAHSKKKVAPLSARNTTEGQSQDLVWSVSQTPKEFLDSPFTPWQEYLRDMLST